MYHSYFGLDDQAFSIAVNPRYLYMSAQHREALAHLLYGVKSGGFVMLSGEVGTGKTTIIRCLLEQMPDNADLAIVLNPSASAKDLLSSICDEFGVVYHPEENSLKVLTDKLTDFLVKNHKEGRKSIVLIDEAQLLRVSTLEQVRLLTNLETNTEKLLQVILVGQPELNELLAKPALRQLSQRITARYHLRPLSETETAAYIKHRLAVAGMPAGHQPFPPKIVHKVYKVSRGIPRLVNILCDRMLLGAYSRETTQVDAEIFRQAMGEVLGETPDRPFVQRYQKAIYGGVAAVGTLILITVVWFLVGAFKTEDKQQVIGAGSIIRDSVAEISETEISEANAGPVGGTEKLWVYNQDRALAELLSVMGVEYDSALYPCWAINDAGMACETQQADTWEGFSRFDRPAVLTLITPSRRTAYVTLVALTQTQAWVSTGGEARSMSLRELGRMWTGEFVFIWHKPELFEEAIGLGSKGEIVTWVAEQFAKLDQQDAPLTRNHFNAQLQKRVKIFQRANDLKDDGFVGIQTLLKLNEALGKEKSLTELAPAYIGVNDQ